MMDIVDDDQEGTSKKRAKNVPAAGGGVSLSAQQPVQHHGWNPPNEQELRSWAMGDIVYSCIELQEKAARLEGGAEKGGWAVQWLDQLRAQSSATTIRNKQKEMKRFLLNSPVKGKKEKVGEDGTYMMS